MRLHGTGRLCLVCVLFTIHESPGTAAPPPAETVVVDPAAQCQTIQGWGTSLCWWANIAGGWKDENFRRVMDLLFDREKGLGLNIVRYNIGGGDAPGHHHMRVGAAVPGFRSDPEKPYDWTADANQRRVLRAAIERGADCLEAFSNSPPSWMTRSGCTAGAEDPRQNNLRDDCYQDFACYLADVIEHFRDAWGIVFDTVDPMNEPGGTWWKAGGRQEGCRFDADGQRRILTLLTCELRKRDLDTRVSAPDAHSIDWALNQIRKWDRPALDAVAQINTHAYKGKRRAELHNLAQRLGKNLWMSEFDMAGRVPGKGHDHESMLPALDLAAAIVRDLRDLRPSAWVLWQAVENEQYCIWWKFNYGLLHADLMYGTEKVWITRKYYAMGHFSKFVRPGACMVDVSAGDAVAFWDRRTYRLVIVTYNRSRAPRRRRYDLSAFNRLGRSASGYRTDPGHKLDVLPELPIRNGVLEAAEPALAISTYVVDHAEYRGVLRMNDTVQQGVNRFEYEGEWSFNGRAPGAFLRDNHWGWRKNDAYRVFFRGVRVRLYGAKGPKQGLAAVSLDGGPENRVDLYAPERHDQALIYESPVLPRGSHVLRVRVTGEKHAGTRFGGVSADRADVTP